MKDFRRPGKSGGARLAAAAALTAAALLAGTTTAAGAVQLPSPPHSVALAAASTPAVEGVLNFREVGGLATRNGGRIRTGVLYRSAALYGATDAGVASLAALRVGKVIDFRSEKEAVAGQDRLPAGTTAVSYPVVANEQIDSIDTVLRMTAAEQQELLGDGRAKAMMLRSSREFVSDPAKRAQFARALHDIAYAPRSSATLVHCTGGRDRTGWMAAVVQRILGASKEDVFAEYLRSNDELAAWKAAMIGRLEAGGMQDPHLLDAFLDVDADYLGAAFDEAVRQYGSFPAFVRHGLGADDATLARLRARLL
ncbi:tyrosine-protein phosphatase [Streptomyces sp. NPDC089919]|uniref:tyrosine-protein phosphatase n=1 Tax=Streptomyces sp. NPDC089919 TaxID=3155188 RepID=UPI003447A5E2